MKIMRHLAVAALFAFGVGAVGSTVFAAEKKVEKKCTADGKECKDGKDCKPEHCKKEEPK